jgi:hypothetical protein
MLTYQTLALSGMFVYFLIGACSAGVAAFVTFGFTGKFPWEAVAIFFLWPLFLLAGLGPLLPFALAVGVAGGLTWLVSKIIT